MKNLFPAPKKCVNCRNGQGVEPYQYNMAAMFDTFTPVSWQCKYCGAVMVCAGPSRWDVWRFMPVVLQHGMTGYRKQKKPRASASAGEGD